MSCVSTFMRRLALTAGLLSTAAGSARADEAFLCGPDTVVYVKPSELEAKKKSDPCIARYFGLEVAMPAPSSAPASGGSAASKDVTRKAVDASSTALAGKTVADTAVALKTLAAPETEAHNRDIAPTRTAAAAPPAPQPGTDYRNVRVINASSPDEQWFKHTR